MVRVSICGKCMIFCNTDQAKLKVFLLKFLISSIPLPLHLIESGVIQLWIKFSVYLYSWNKSAWSREGIFVIFENQNGFDAIANLLKLWYLSLEQVMNCKWWGGLCDGKDFGTRNYIKFNFRFNRGKPYADEKTLWKLGENPSYAFQKIVIRKKERLVLWHKKRGSTPLLLFPLVVSIAKIIHFHCFGKWNVVKYKKEEALFLRVI